MLAQVVDQLIEHLRRQLQLHELAANPLAQFLRLRILRAEFVERVQVLVLDLGDGHEAPGGLLRIRTGVDGLLFLLAVGLVVVVGGDLALECHDFRILGLRDLIRCVRIDEADDDVHQAHLAGFDVLVVPEKQIVGAGIAAEGDLDRLKTLLDALGDANLALAGEQFHRAHLAHVHAHRIGGAAEFGIQIGERRGGFLDRLLVRRRSGVGQQQGLGIRRLLVHRDAHVVDHVDDIFDLFRIDDFAGQMIVDFRVGQVTLFLAARNQQFQLRLTLVRDLSRCARRRFLDQGGRLVKSMELNAKPASIRSQLFCGHT